MTDFSQDSGQSQQPYPATSASVTNPSVSAAGDLFGTGITSSCNQNCGRRLFLEHNTIPSGCSCYASSWNLSFKVGGKVPPAHVNAPSADIGLPGGGVPAQSAEQPITPESIALPGGHNLKLSHSTQLRLLVCHNLKLSHLRCCYPLSLST